MQTYETLCLHSDGSGDVIAASGYGEGSRAEQICQSIVGCLEVLPRGENEWQSI